MRLQLPMNEKPGIGLLEKRNAGWASSFYWTICMDSSLTLLLGMELMLCMNCLGCRIANAIEPNLNIVYENELITCVLDIAPFNEGHTLILPKKHYWDVEEMDTKTAYDIMDAAKRLSTVLKILYKPDGITICQNGGKFNDLTHYHMHLIPRYEGDGFSWGEPLHHHGAEKRLSQTKENIIKILNEEKRGL
jgi:histidine triad (HIT) family protein